jgi:hypothetical protein
MSTHNMSTHNVSTHNMSTHNMSTHNMSTRFAAHELVAHDENLNLLFCRLCSYAIGPGEESIDRHFFRNHRGITDAERQVLKPVFGGVVTIDSTGTNKSATAEQKAAIYAVEDQGYCHHLLPPVPGFRCTVAPGCRYCATTLSSLKRHRVDDHAAKKLTYRNIHVQSLFNGTGRQYFEVEPTPPAKAIAISRSEEEVMAGYQAARSAYQRQLAIVAEQDGAHPNMFEDRMGWAVLLEGQDLGELGRQSNPEWLEDGDIGIDANEIWRASKAMARSCHSALKGTNHIIRRYLYSVNERISETPLGPVRRAETVSEYADGWARFVVFVCRLSRWSQTQRAECHIIISPTLLAALEQVVAVFGVHNHSDDRRQPLEDAIFQFSTLILGQRIGVRQNESPLLYFLAVEGWKAEGRRWKNPPEYSGLLSAMVYLLRAIAAKELDVRRQTQELSVEDDFNFIRTYHSQRLVSGCGGVFDEIFNRRCFTQEVARDWYTNPKVQWSLTQDSLSYEGEHVKIADMRSLLQGLLGSAEAWICRLLGTDIGYLAMYDPTVLQDDLAWANSGGSIIDMNPCLQGGEERMNRRGIMHETYWSRIWTKSRADRQFGMYASSYHPVGANRNSTTSVHSRSARGRSHHRTTVHAMRRRPSPGW